MTLSLDEQVAEELHDAVEQGLARSQSSLVEDAVAQYLVRARREALRTAYGDAAEDPAFLSDLEAVRRDFQQTDEEMDR